VYNCFICGTPPLSQLLQQGLKDHLKISAKQLSFSNQECIRILKLPHKSTATCLAHNMAAAVAVRTSIQHKSRRSASPTTS
jgi:hypothetical protein